VPVRPNSHDELGEMAESFNILQQEVRDAALGLGEAREKLRHGACRSLSPGTNTSPTSRIMMP
jgi:hypothetical protein